MVWNLLNWVIHHFLFELIHFFGWERILEAAHFIQDDTQCPNVCFLSILLVFPKLWRKIKRRSYTIILGFLFLCFLGLNLSALIHSAADLFSADLLGASKLIIDQIIISSEEIIINHVKWIVGLFHQLVQMLQLFVL